MKIRNIIFCLLILILLSITIIGLLLEKNHQENISRLNRSQIIDYDFFKKLKLLKEIDASQITILKSKPEDKNNEIFSAIKRLFAVSDKKIYIATLFFDDFFFKQIFADFFNILSKKDISILLSTKQNIEKISFINKFSNFKIKYIDISLFSSNKNSGILCDNIIAYDSAAIFTSADFSFQSFYENIEYGLYINNPLYAKKLINVFNDNWKFASGLANSQNQTKNSFDDFFILLEYTPSKIDNYNILNFNDFLKFIHFTTKKELILVLKYIPDNKFFYNFIKKILDKKIKLFIITNQEQKNIYPDLKFKLYKIDIKNSGFNKNIGLLNSNILIIDKTYFVIGNFNFKSQENIENKSICLGIKSKKLCDKLINLLQEDI